MPLIRHCCPCQTFSIEQPGEDVTDHGPFIARIISSAGSRRDSPRLPVGRTGGRGPIGARGEPAAARGMAGPHGSRAAAR